MKAIAQDVYGDVDVLELRDIAQPVPGPDEVLLRVPDAGVDPGVWHLMTGLPYLIRPAFGLRAPKTRVRGRDVAGRVESVGANVIRFRPGDEVFGTCEGSFAEYACARADRLAVKPANLTFEQAAAVPISALTALQGLRGRVRPGNQVLIIGAGGGVGTFAVQLAKSDGAHVTGVCGPSKVDLVRSLGADVIDYTREDFADRAGRYDLILDMVGNRALSHLRRALAPRGTLVIAGGEEGGHWLGGIDRMLRALLLSPFVRHRLRGLISTENADDLQVLRELIEGGKLTPIIDRTFTLAEVPDAIRHVHNGHSAGKVVVTI